MSGIEPTASVYLILILLGKLCDLLRLGLRVRVTLRDTDSTGYYYY